jgi:hypothetical protein
MGFSKELLRKSRRLLSSNIANDDNISDEQARESLHNIAGFFGVLLDWHRADTKNCPNGNGTENHQAIDQGERDEP